MNYRIDLDRSTVFNAIQNQDWQFLTQHDQLLVQKRTNPSIVFKDFQEGYLNFLPTFKYDLNSDVYDTSEKKRVPSWYIILNRIYLIFRLGVIEYCIKEMESTYSHIPDLNVNFRIIDQ